MSERTKSRHEEDAEMFEKGWKAGFKEGREAFKRELRHLLDVPSAADLAETRGDV